MILPDVRREEWTRFSYAAGAFMCVASAALISRTIGDTIYLTRFGSGRLALMYIGTAVIMAVLSLAFATVAGKWSIGRSIAVVATCIVAGCIAVRAGLYSDASAVRVATYFFAELVIRIPTLLFWAYVTLVFDPREAKRMIGLIGAAGTLACIAAGAVVPRYVNAFGTANLLYLVGALIAGFALLVRRSGAGNLAPRTSDTNVASAGIGYYASLLKRGEVRSVAALVALSSFALILNDYVFKSTAREHFSGRDLAAFFGSFYSVASVAALVLQLFVVHQILARGGLGVALRILPTALFAVSVLVAVTGSFYSIILAKFLEPFLDFTINAAAMQMLYLGIAKQSRQQVRAFIDGIMRPLAVAFAGVAILSLIGSVEIQYFAAIVAIVCALWLLAGRASYMAYKEGLRASIGAQRFDASSSATDLSDPALSAHVRDALRNAPDRDLPYVLSLADYWSDVDWTPEYRLLLDRDSADVRIRALEYLARHGDESDVERVKAQLTSDDPEVRRAAVLAVSRLVRPQPADLLWERVRGDSDPRVRAVAAAELINHGELDDLIEAATTFRSMLSSSSKPERIAAANSVALLSREAVTSALNRLLDDEDPDVQVVALEGVKAQPADSLIDAVVRLVPDPRVGWKAAQTLVAFGPRALQPLRALVRQVLITEPPPAYAFLLPAMLAQIPGGISLLAELIDASDLQLRHAATRAFCDAVRQEATTARDEPTQRIVEREIGRAQRAREARESLAAIDASLLKHALDDDFRLHVDAVLHLMQLQNPAIVPAALLDPLLTGERRADAVELLDNLLPPLWKKRVLTMFETGAKTTADAVATLRSLIESRSSLWVVIGAVHAAGELKLAALHDVIAEVHRDEHAARSAREAAASALAKLDGHEKVRQTDSYSVQHQ